MSIKKSHRVLFFADSHSYWGWNESQNQYRKVLSAGAVISKLKPPFMRDYWLSVKGAQAVDKDGLGELIKAKGGKNTLSYQSTEEALDIFLKTKMDNGIFFSEREKIADQWLLKNGFANYRGTRFHDQYEAMEREQGYGIDPWTGEKVPHVNKVMDWDNCDNHSIVSDLSELEPGYYTELLVFLLDEDGNVILTGQADRVWITQCGDYKYFKIGDHKTTEKKPGKSDMNKLIPPFNHLYASKHQTYCIQIRLYAYMLEQFGLIAENLSYTWYKDYVRESECLIEVPYGEEEKDEIRRMVQFYLNN